MGTLWKLTVCSARLGLMECRRLTSSAAARPHSFLSRRPTEELPPLQPRRRQQCDQPGQESTCRGGRRPARGGLVRTSTRGCQLPGGACAARPAAGRNAPSACGGCFVDGGPRGAYSASGLGYRAARGRATCRRRRFCDRGASGARGLVNGAGCARRCRRLGHCGRAVSAAAAPGRGRSRGLVRGRGAVLTTAAPGGGRSRGLVRGRGAVLTTAAPGRGRSRGLVRGRGAVLTTAAPGGGRSRSLVRGRGAGSAAAPCRAGVAGIAGRGGA